METVQTFYEQITGVVAPYLPRLAAGLLILVVGWIVAHIVAAVVRGALRRTTIDNKIAAWFAGDERAAAMDVESGAGKIVYYIAMLFVLVMAFQTLGLTMVTEPLNGLLNQIFEFIPRLAGAGLLLAVAWAIGTLLKLLVVKLLEATTWDERLTEESGEPVEHGSIGKAVGEALYWFVFLLFLPGILDALSLEGMLEPVNTMISTITGFLPHLFTAAVTLAVGWLVARIVQKIVVGFLAAVGLDALADRVGVGVVLGGQKLSKICGLVVYVFVFIPILITALSALQLDAVTGPLSNMLTMILEAIPAVFGALLVLAFSYGVGRVVAGLVTNLLSGIGFNNILQLLGIGRSLDADDKGGPSAVVGSIVLSIIMLFAATEAAGMLGFDAMSGLVSQIILFAGKLLVGIVMLALALWLANLASTAVRASGVAHSGLLANVARVAILMVVGAMALEQMGLGSDIVQLAFGLTLGAVAVASAIAFGIGGRDVAARQIEGWAGTLESPSPKTDG